MARTRGGYKAKRTGRQETDTERTVSNEREASVESVHGDTEGARVESVNEDTEEELSPVKFHFQHPEWIKICKIATRCDIRKTVRYLETRLEGWELEWFRNHPQFRHLFHMPRQPSRRLMGMWMLLLRTVDMESTKQCWFLVNGMPISYSIVEHALLSGLNCKALPAGYNNFGSNELVLRCFEKDEKIDLPEIKTKLDSMDANGEDRLKVAVLYFLAKIIKGKSKLKDGYIEPFLLRVVDDLDVCQTFPWGTYSFDNIMEEITHLMEYFEGQVGAQWIFPGFILPLEALAYECIPSLKKKFRKDVIGADKSCPRLCKSEFKRVPHTGISLGKVYEALGTTKDIKCLVPTNDELPLLERILDGDHEELVEPVPEAWLQILSEHDDGIYMKDLFEKDVASRAELHTVCEAEEGPAEDDVDATSVDQKIEALKKNMEKRYKQLEVNLRKTYDAKFRSYKESMEKHIRKIIETTYGKSTKGKRPCDEGESSVNKVVEDLVEEEEDLGEEDLGEEDSDSSYCTLLRDAMKRVKKRRKGERIAT